VGVLTIFRYILMRIRKNPLIVRVRTQERGLEIMRLCTAHGRQVIVGVEPDKPEDISDVEKVLGLKLAPSHTKIKRNEPCPCGSKRKYKNCCGA
jgi:SWIM/SEC-C metal-binding protein